MTTYLVIPDLHFRFMDPKFLGLVEVMLQWIKPQGIIQLGDFVDCPQISEYDKDPSRKESLWEDIELYNKMLDLWESLLPVGGEFHQLEGNHEDRLRRYVWRNAPKIQALVRDWPDLLNFPERNARGRLQWSWYNLNKWDACKIGDTVFHHGKFFDKHVAVNNLTRYQCNLVTGHTHRFQHASDGKHISLSLGHGSDAAQTMHEPVPGAWQQSLNLYHVDYRGRGWHEPVLVRDGEAMVRGQLLRVS